ncbi:MAG TPA: FAD-binding oxidoreductase [Steroidobacteraceae bacterium]|nr:FAD-binding oxidoreductase [Steroidobacteraceae bacterium]
MNPPPPRSAAMPRVIVIGAGILGCSAAFHLLKCGVRELTLIDAVRAGGSTSGAGAGFVSHWSAGFLEQFGAEGIALQEYGLEFYRTLAAGGEIGYRPHGTLQLALTAQGYERFARPVLDSPLAPPGTRRLTARESGALMAGLIDPAAVHAAVLNPHGIQVETGLANSALAEQVRALGGRLNLGARVVGIEEHASSVQVDLPRERLEADLVVLAAGAWNNEMLALIGWHLPLFRMLATRIVTDDRGLPSHFPTVQCRELRLWLRESFGALTWGTVAGYAPLHRWLAPGAVLEPGQPHHPELLDALLQQQEALAAIFPPLRGARIATWTQGIPCYTPDQNLICGRVPGHPRLIVMGGDNETGVTHGPGLGRLAAELALERAPFVDPARMRPERFKADDYPTEASVESALAASFLLSSTRAGEPQRGPAAPGG